MVFTNNLIEPYVAWQLFGYGSIYFTYFVSPSIYNFVDSTSLANINVSLILCHIYFSWT